MLPASSYIEEHSSSLVFGKYHQWKILNLALGGVAQMVGGMAYKPQKVVGSILVRAHTWVEGSIPSQGIYRGQRMDVSLSNQCLSLSLSFLPHTKSNEKMSLGKD